MSETEQYVNIFSKLPRDCLDKIFSKNDYKTFVNMASSCLYLYIMMRDFEINFKTLNLEERNILLRKLFIHLFKILIELFKTNSIDLISIEAQNKKLQNFVSATLNLDREEQNRSS